MSKLAEKIARHIFETGGDKEFKVQRLQFMAGEYPDNEIPHGGFNETALAECIAEILEE